MSDIIEPCPKCNNKYVHVEISGIIADPSKSGVVSTRFCWICGWSSDPDRTAEHSKIKRSVDGMLCDIDSLFAP